METKVIAAAYKKVLINTAHLTEGKSFFKNKTKLTINGMAKESTKWTIKENK